jgi:hypothetical protein
VALGLRFVTRKLKPTAAAVRARAARPSSLPPRWPTEEATTSEAPAAHDIAITKATAFVASLTADVTALLAGHLDDMLGRAAKYTMESLRRDVSGEGRVGPGPDNDEDVRSRNRHEARRLRRGEIDLIPNLLKVRRAAGAEVPTAEPEPETPPPQEVQVRRV